MDDDQLQVDHAESAPSPSDIRAEVERCANPLVEALRSALAALPAQPRGPQALADRLHLDKVLASRLLKALQSPDALTALYRLPGPEPLRRVLKSLARAGVPAARVRAADQLVGEFERLLAGPLSDRSELDALLSDLVPDARREFQQRRKQAIFRNLSQLRGVECATLMACVLLRPSASGEHIDVVWINGMFGLRRLRSSASVKIATRRLGPLGSTAGGSAGVTPERTPLNLDGRPVEQGVDVFLSPFCSSPMPALRVERVGQVVHYHLAGAEFGIERAADLVFGEVNTGEMPRFVPRDSGRRRYVFAEISVPARTLQFDAFVHESLECGEPELIVYDTAFEGVASVNDRARDADALDLVEAVEPLREPPASALSGDVPRYAELVRSVMDRLGWSNARTPGVYRGFRCRSQHPLYGTQYTLAFRAQTK
ncbi:MAG: hypothetical protein SFZ23_16260 [Planctomycetota bacterium]|nr:hypothetical protein [Planctomycetota bacterium]